MLEALAQYLLGHNLPFPRKKIEMIEIHTTENHPRKQQLFIDGLDVSNSVISYSYARDAHGFMTLTVKFVGPVKFTEV